MKNILLFIGVTTIVLLGLQNAFTNPFLSVSKSKKVRPEFKEGDIIFQSSVSDQCKAIQMATHSLYSHVGMLTKQNGKWMVLEAVQPVCLTPIEDFIGRGEKNHFVIKRLKTGSFAGGECYKKYQKDNLGKNYDAYFGWADDRLYCSELVWKVYKQCCNVEPGPLEKIKDLDLSHPLVKAKLTERYGKNIPYEEKVITPGAMFDSPLLIEVYQE